MSSNHNIPSGEHLVDRHYTRGDPQYQEMMKQVAQDGHQCPFCTMAVHPKPILHEVGKGTAHHWFITERHAVPGDVEQYLMIIPGRHLENYQEMTTNDHLMVQRLVEWAEQEFSLEGFGLLLRSGASRRTGATVRHLHYHIIMPEIDSETDRAKTYNFPIG